MGAFTVMSTRVLQTFSSITISALLALSLIISSRAAYGDWTNVWSDEFDGTSIDTSKWTFDTGTGCPSLCGWGNSELEYYTSRTNNVYVADGMLHIIARQESYMGSSYTSARLKTQGLFAKKYGRFEFRARLPHGQGYWPALWMMPRDSVYGGWAASGEIDIMENKGSSYNIIGGTDIFGGQYPDQQYDSTSYTVPTAVTNFHVYAFEWTTNSLKWYVDDFLYKTATNWWSSGGSYPAPFDQYFYILMNLAVGGNYGGDPDGTTVFPGEMDVDYVRVYDYVEATNPPSTPTGLTATVGGTQITLNWSNSTTATSYNVKRATVSGGPYTTIANPSANSYTDTNVLNCTTYYYVVSATNSLGESTNSVEVSAALGGYSLAVNSGGSAASPFVADAYVSGGTVAAPTGSAIDTTGVTNSAPQAVYQTERYGTFTYAFGGLTTGTAYKVRLHEAEFYWNAANKRTFNVTINGTQVLTNYDIFVAAGGQYKAIVPEFMTTPNSSGQIVVQFTVGSVDEPKSSGIEIILPTPSAPTGLTASGGVEQVALAWNAVPGANGYGIYRSMVSGGPYVTVTNGATGTTYTDTGLADGTLYYYVVTTTQGSCQSTNSVEVSATTTAQLTPFQQWQMNYFNCTNCPQADANADPDGDGQNNMLEFLAGTDPTDSTSSLRIVSIEPEGNDIRVTWTMGSGRTNALQAAAGDGGGDYVTNFTDIFTVTNTVGTVTNYLDTNAATNAPARYYRVRIVP